MKMVTILIERKKRHRNLGKWVH